MTEKKSPPMRDDFPRWYRPVSLSPTRDLLEARWEGLARLVENADTKSVETMLAIALRTKHCTDAAQLATLRQHFKDIDDLFDMEGNDRELEVLSAAALVTLFDYDDDRSAHAALATTTASCRGVRVADFPVDLVMAAEVAISRMCEARRRRPNLSTAIAQEVVKVGIDQPSIENLKQEFNADTVSTILVTLTKQTQSSTRELFRRINSLVQSMDTFTAIQDEELQMLWWLFGGRSKLMDCPFSSIPADAQPMILAAEVADATEFLPGPVSAKPILSRAGLKERRKLSIPTTVNACDEALLAAFIDGVNPSPVTHPLHFAIKRKLETHDETSWVAPWSSITGIESSFALPGIELGNLFYRERLNVLFEV